MIRVWSDNLSAGLLDRHNSGRSLGAAFVYDQRADAARAVSVTMPVRLASWDIERGIHPIFEMNLPEGILRERLRLAFAKATGTFDDFDLLSVVGRSQIGRLRFSATDGTLDEDVPFQAVDEILQQRRDGGLFAFLMQRFAAFSGISGVQPKVLIRDDEVQAIPAIPDKTRKSPHFRGATHIVKFWHPEEYPQLAANEFFCLRAAEKCRLVVPRFRLAQDGSALVVDRFDLRADGTYRGLEDFCVLNGFKTSDKYKGGYETVLFKRAQQFITGETLSVEMEKLFTLFVLNCVLRNGDAHLKNFALIYDDVAGQPQLSPVFDIVTTTVYIPKDTMANTLGGTTKWPDAKKLTALATLRCGLTPRRTREIFDLVATAVSETAVELAQYSAAHPEFAAIGGRMRQEWSTGITETLGSARFV